MARSVEDLELCMRTMITATASRRSHKTEANLLPLPYRQTKLPKKLRLGYFIEGLSGY